MQLSSCWGCHQSLLNAHLELLPVLPELEIVYWPAVVDFKLDSLKTREDGEIDIGIVGGQIVGPYWTGGYIVSDIDASSGKYYWSVPSDSTYVGNYWRVFVGDLPLEEPGYFRVKPGRGVYDRSEGYFSIK